VTGHLAVDPTDPLPLYAQLDRAIRAAIGTGRLARGERLPTVRQLAVDLSINANTVARVYLDLERAGIVETRRGVGTFVAATPPALGARPGRASELQALVGRALEEAAAKGFSVDDVLRQVRAVSEGDR
jgi:GntR family transcriptional regulator